MLPPERPGVAELSFAAAAPRAVPEAEATGDAEVDKEPEDGEAWTERDDTDEVVGEEALAAGTEGSDDLQRKSRARVGVRSKAWMSENDARRGGARVQDVAR
jgi:hypothetical protein